MKINCYSVIPVLTFDVDLSILLSFPLLHDPEPAKWQKKLTDASLGTTACVIKRLGMGSLRDLNKFPCVLVSAPLLLGTSWSPRYHDPRAISAVNHLDTRLRSDWMRLFGLHSDHRAYIASSNPLRKYLVLSLSRHPIAEVDITPHPGVARFDTITRNVVHMY
jgi:hypothetical protein